MAEPEHDTFGAGGRARCDELAPPRVPAHLTERPARATVTAVSRRLTSRPPPPLIGRAGRVTWRKRDL